MGDLYSREVNFKNYNVSEITKEIVENYINEKRQKTPRLAKDLFLLIRAVLTYAKDKKGSIKEVPNFDLKFQKKKRAKVAKVCYLPEDKQKVWLDVCEEDKRPFALLFATLLQTSMRPEEGCGLKWKSVHFNQNKIKVENAYKDITLYDDEMNITGHIMTDGDLKTTESYRNIPMAPRLKEMLLNLKREKMNNLQYGQEWDNNEYVFLNTIGTPYVPERLTKKITEFIKKYKLEHMTIYGFRHSFATLMSEKGMDKELLRELMGHAEFQTTDFYYIHVSEEGKKKEKETKKIYDNLKEQLIYIQENIKNAVDYIYNVNEIEELKAFTYSQRYAVYLIKRMGKLYSYIKNDNIILDNYSNKYDELGYMSENELLSQLKEKSTLISMSNTHKSNDISSICYAILEELSKINNYPIKKCQNCGMYFIPNSRLDEIYCDYPKENGKTCREQGAILSYNKRLQVKSAYTEYRKTYQQKFRIVNKNKDDKNLKKEFETWKKQAKEKITKLKHGELTEDEVYEWILKNK